MKTTFLISFSLSLLLGITACAGRRVARGTTFVIGPECKATAVLTGCDVSTDPPTGCKHTKINYPRGCGKVVAKP